MARHLENGRIAEVIACRYLNARGLSTLSRNYRCRYGELDLVMREAGLLVIVEIRYRRDTSFGGALASVSAVKRSRIAAATQHFIRRYPACREMPVRFDVIGLTGALPAPDIHWVAGAFTMDDL